MKKINLILLGVVLTMFFATSCEKMEKINKDPNNPESVPSNMIFSGAQKRMMDYVYDNWFSGRQSLVYSQFWAQNNYNEEDRYQIRPGVNNNYFNHHYTSITSLNRVIDLNTDPETAPGSAVYGANANQIAAAKIMRAWMFSIITDTWGDVPYFDANKLKENVYYPKYDAQATIYEELIKELTEAANMIDVNQRAFTGGDMMYSGDALKWKKFANSLKARLALRTSKVSGSKWKQYIDEAVAGGVFTSNADVASYKYSSSSPEQCWFYRGFFIESRNDFSITRTFADILKGVRDTLNNKTHPWEGTVDPRLTMFTTSHNNGTYIGLPYGAVGVTSYTSKAPNWGSNPPMQLRADFPVPIMTYAEVQFILSERNGFSMAEYEKGVEASIDYWAGVSGQAVSAANKAAYLSAVTQQVNAEAVALQKYIDLFINGMEAWSEARRTGYPVQLIKPGEILVDASETTANADIKFTPLSDTKGILVARVPYPTNESTLNKANFDAAVAKLEEGTNNYFSPMFFDKRRSEGPHPANK